MKIDAPDGFLQMQSANREIRLTTAEQARVWVREFDDPDQGSLEFWCAALRNDLMNRRGYALRDEGELSDGRGQTGRFATFATTIEGEPTGYLTAVWVDEGRSNTIRVAEFVAPMPEFEARFEEVQAALRTLRP